MIDRQHLAGLKGVGEGARHHQAVLEHVGNAAGRAHVVFQHQNSPGLGIAHQVDAADVRVNAARHLEADHFAPEVLAGIDQRRAESCGP